MHTTSTCGEFDLFKDVQRGWGDVSSSLCWLVLHSDIDRIYALKRWRKKKKRKKVKLFPVSWSLSWLNRIFSIHLSRHLAQVHVYKDECREDSEISGDYFLKGFRKGKLPRHTLWWCLCAIVRTRYLSWCKINKYKCGLRFKTSRDRIKSYS